MFTFTISDWMILVAGEIPLLVVGQLVPFRAEELHVVPVPVISFNSWKSVQVSFFWALGLTEVSQIFFPDFFNLFLSILSI